jgi:hypothetical protein
MDDKLQEASSASNETEVAPVDSAPVVEAPIAEDANTNAATDTSPVDEKQVVEPKSLMEAVKAAADKDSKAGEPITPEQKDAVSETESKPNETPTDEVKKGEDPAKDEKVPFHKHPRWQEMIRERDSFKDEASQYRQITGYMSQNQLSNDEVAKGFEIMALMKNDPLRAREMLLQYTRALDEYAGVILPEDLSKKVDEGAIDEAAAQELARTRNEALANRARYEQLAQTQQVQHQQAAQEAIQREVFGWEETIKQRDVDYAAKQNLVLDRARTYLTQGQPRTPQEAVAIVERAYADVNETLKGFAPRRQPVRAVSSTSSTTNSQPVARTLQEAIRIAAGTN